MHAHAHQPASSSRGPELWAQALQSPAEQVQQQLQPCLSPNLARLNQILSSALPQARAAGAARQLQAALPDADPARPAR